MSLKAVCAEGLCPSAQYRAFALLAALQRRVGVNLSPATSGTAALSLLSAQDQFDVAHAGGILADTSLPRQPATPSFRHIWFATKDMMGEALIEQSVGVMLDGAPPSYDAAVATGLAQIFAFASPQQAAAGAGIVVLPRAVHPAFLAAPEKEQSPSRKRVVALCACHEESSFAEAVFRVAAATNLDACSLSPNRRPDVFVTDKRRLGAVSPMARHAAWQHAQLGLVHSCIDIGNDAFCDEATSLGVSLHALDTRTTESLSSFDPWLDAPSRSQHESATEAFISFDALADILLDAQAQQSNVVLAALQGRDARVFAGLSVEELSSTAGEAQPEHEYALVIVGSESFDAEQAGALAMRFGYANVFADLVTQSLLATTVIQQSIMARLNRQVFAPNYMTGAMELDGLLAGATTWLRQAPHRVLHVLVSPNIPLHAARFLRRLQAAAQPAATRLRVLIDGKTPEANQRVSGATIGVEVAGRDLVRSILYGNELRGQSSFWPRLKGDTSELRTIMPTLRGSLSRPDFDQRVVDACQPKFKGDDVRTLLERDEIDVIYTGSGPFIDGLVAARNAWAKFAVPVIGSLHSIHGLGIAMQMLQQRVVAPLAPFDGFISPTRCGKEAMLRQWRGLSAMLEGRAKALPDPAIDVVPYGVQTSFYAGRDKMACRLATGVARDVLLFVQVGRINRVEKGDLAPLLFAFSEVVRAHDNAHLVIVGKAYTTEEMERVRKLINKLALHQHVEVRDDVSAEQKAQLLCAADASVSVSDNVQETYGLVLLEAMAAGTPVIAPAWNGFRELVDEGETGLLVDCQWSEVPPERLFQQQISIGHSGYGWRDLHETVAIDVGGLVRAMCAICENPERAQEMGHKAQRYAQAHQDTYRQGAALQKVLAERARAAREAAPHWQRPQVWVEDIVSSFSHYPQTTLDADVAVVATERALDPQMRAHVFFAMQLASDAEQQAISRLIDRAQRTPITLRELEDPRLDLLRLMRCIKYGLIRVIAI